MDSKEELESELQRVKYRLEILDMIEERLLQMKALAEEVLEGKLNGEEIERVNMELQYLQEQVRLLEENPTEKS